jgi:hypothetical protein
MGSEASERSEKNPITTSKGNTEGNSYVPVDLYFKCSGRAALNFFFPTTCLSSRVILLF